MTSAAKVGNFADISSNSFGRVSASAGRRLSKSANVAGRGQEDQRELAGLVIFAREDFKSQGIAVKPERGLDVRDADHGVKVFHGVDSHAMNRFMLGLSCMEAAYRDQQLQANCGSRREFIRPSAGAAVRMRESLRRVPQQPIPGKSFGTPSKSMLREFARIR